MRLRTKSEQKAYLDGFERCAECIEKYLSDEGKQKLECLLITVRNAVESEDKMTKAELMLYVGKKVHIYFKDGDKEYGTLGYVNEFSAKYGYRKPNDFYIGNISFKASLVRKLAESEDKE